MSEIDDLRKEVAELRAWKESAMKVMAPYQEIGAAIGLTPGQDIHDKILPWILAAKKRLLPEGGWPDGDAFDWTVDHALTYALHLLREKKVYKNGEPTKCYIVFLNDDDNNYGTREINSGLKRSEVVALMEIMKYRLMFDLHQPVQADEDTPKDTKDDDDDDE